mgnify:FL=1
MSVTQGQRSGRFSPLESESLLVSVSKTELMFLVKINNDFLCLKGFGRGMRMNMDARLFGVGIFGSDIFR